MSSGSKRVGGYAQSTIASKAKVSNNKRQVCQEKYICSADEQTAASEHCEDCGTDQCSSCAEGLHHDPNLRTHLRLPLEIPLSTVVCTQPASIVTTTTTAAAAAATASSEEEEQWQDCSTEDFTDGLADNRLQQEEEEKDYDTVARKRTQRSGANRSSDNSNIPIPITTTISSGGKKRDPDILEVGAVVDHLQLEPTESHHYNIDISDIKDQSNQRAGDNLPQRKVGKDQGKPEATLDISPVGSLGGGGGSPQADDSSNAKLNTPGEVSLAGGGGGGKKKKRPTSGAIGGRQATAGDRVLAVVDELLANNSDDTSDAGAADLFGTLTSADGAGSSSSDDSSGNSNSEGYASSGSRQKAIADSNSNNASNSNMANNASGGSTGSTQPMDIEANKKKKSKKVAKSNAAESGNNTSSCASSVSPGTSPPMMTILPTNTQSPLINIDVEPNMAQLSLENATTAFKIGGGGRVYNKSGKKKVADKPKRTVLHQPLSSKNLLLDDDEDVNNDEEEDDRDVDEDDEPKEDDDQEEEEEEEEGADDDDDGMSDIDLGGGNYKRPGSSPGGTTNPKTNRAGSAASSDGPTESFLLVNEEEILQVKSAEEFIAKLGCGCDERTLVKVVSIFGNTGEGKSHTLNYTFYDCREMFGTSPTQNSCTIGIWCAYDPTRRVITIDTEGLLGMSDNNNRRTRLLLKVLAISDVIIYRTRAERLHTDLFTFLGTASSAYIKHFAKELKAASERCNLQCTLSDLGPVVIIFHETVHTEVLHKEDEFAPEDIIRQRFNAMNLSTEAYSAFEYVGIRTRCPPTNFDTLRATVHRHLTNSTVRSARTPGVIFNALNVLSRKFSGDVSKAVLNPFPDEYFTCSELCLSCNARCSLAMNHAHDGQAHKSDAICRYQHQYANQIYFCRLCFERGEMSPVTQKMMANGDSAWMGMARYAWSGAVLECRHCGIIYRARQYWFGNKEPTEQSVVRTEILHVWNGEPLPSQSAQNAAQRMVDSMSYLSETVSTISAKPTKMMSDWIADRIAPPYWVPNARLQHCGKCEKEFADVDSKHHCRRCGGGFCEACSGKTQPVPERGWGDVPVRVCDDCFEKGQRSPDIPNSEVTARKVGEVLQNTLGSVISTIDYPLGWIKNSARPDYWVPDHECSACALCKDGFNERNPIHHCRACGQGVCDGCSAARKAVPSRGWDDLVRVCNDCANKKTVVKDA